MKKYLLSTVALILAIVFSSYTKQKKPADQNTGMLYWFAITSYCYRPFDVVPAYRAEYIIHSPYPPDAGCQGGFCQCISGFGAEQVNLNADPYQLKDDVQSPQFVVTMQY